MPARGGGRSGRHRCRGGSFGRRPSRGPHFGLVLCKVDASYGSIRPGDLLVASPTPGHAMKHTEALAGTILGKALGRLDDGAGLIKILLTVR